MNKIDFKKLNETYGTKDEDYYKLKTRTYDLTEKNSGGLLTRKYYQREMAKLNKKWDHTRYNFFDNNEELKGYAEQLFMSAYAKYCATKGDWILSPINLATLFHFEHTSEDDLPEYNQNSSDLMLIKNLIDDGYFKYQKGYTNFYLLTATQKAIDFCEKYLPDELKTDGLLS